MKTIIEGVRKFQRDVYPEQIALFNKLSKGQTPETLFVTCSDSRIDSSLLTQTQPGDMFVLRNAGNLVPAFGASNGGEASAIEYAVDALNVKHIIVCGHSHCGAMAALMKPESLKNLPTVSQWLQHAASTRHIVNTKYHDKECENLPLEVVKENVLVQLSNLRTHPSVAAKLAMGEIDLHGWVYVFETGTVLIYDHEKADFIAIQPE